MNPTVVLIDDHAVLRLGLRQLLRQSGFEVSGEAEDCTTGLALIQATNPEVAVVDLSLGAQDGVPFVAQLHAAHPTLKLLVYSMHEDPHLVRRVLQAGASGYVSKHEPPQAVVEGIAQIRAGRTHVSPALCSRLTNLWAQPDPSPPLAALSPREQEVFAHLGRGFSVAEIAEALGVSPRTVESHLARIKVKLHLTSVRELRRHAIQLTKTP